MAKRDPNQDNEPVHFGQIFFDDMFLLLLLGVAAPFMIYTAWGLMDTGSIPQLPPTPYSTAQAASSETSPTDKVTLGEQLAQQLGCLACHSTDGSARVGPSWKGLFGASVPLADGSAVTADETYLKESILSPNEKIVQGFAANIMPLFYQDKLSPAELAALIAYIESLK
jgi:mono/diheme cytochrome c family protein